MAATWKLVVRRTGATEKNEHATLAEAVSAIRAHVTAAERRGTVKAFARDIEPVMQVVVRAELRGPGGRGGVDVRGDGSTEAYTGSWRKRLVEPRPGEDAIAALARALAS